MKRTGNFAASGLATLLVIAACGHGGPHIRHRAESPDERGRLAVRLQPPAGRVLHGWGQFSSAWNLGQREGEGDSADLAGYERAVSPNVPAMISFYVAPDAGMLPRFLGHYREFVRSHGWFVAQVGLYFQSLQREVARGDRDAELRELATALRDARRPVIMRIGYEFNNPWQLYDPNLYVRSFRHIVTLLQEQGADNVAAAWNATAIGLKGPPWLQWYPGDDVVDWWSVNLFDFPDFTQSQTAAFLEDASRRHKPVLVGEASPVFQTRWPGRVRGATSQSEILAWNHALFKMIRDHPEIQAFSMIAVDWHRLKSILPGWGWPNARLDGFPIWGEAYRQGLSDPRFIHAREAELIYRQRSTEIESK